LVNLLNYTGNRVEEVAKKCLKEKTKERESEDAKSRPDTGEVHTRPTLKLRKNYFFRGTFVIMPSTKGFGFKERNFGGFHHVK